MKKLTIAIVILITSTGCASITTGQDQIVSVETPNCPAASCSMTNKDGTYFVSTPGTVTVNRACGELTIECSVEGHPATIVRIGSSVKPMAYGNILFGGLIGAGVDAATGAACEYPSLIPVPMECGATITAEELQRELPENVQEVAEKLECVDVQFAGQASDRKNVYTASCKDSDSILTCDDKGCRESKIEIGPAA